ncbi:MAG TPA: M48 family metalloprotease [Candidatus Saccharimonadales bacterium]|nr:M48 family metalloprotease [Candidatus Saccharimonadales bacterium]
MYSAISANKRNTFIIMLVFIAIIAGLGWLFSEAYGSTGIFWGTLVGATIYALIQYFAAAKMALALNRAREIKKVDNPRLYRMVENIAITDGLPTPRVYIMDDPSPNAFATGRDPKHSHVCVTTGLLELMDDRELEAVIAHEMGHIKNYDIRVMMVVFGLVAAIGLIADIFTHMLWFGGDRREGGSPIFLVLGIIAALLAPIVAMIVQLAVSRQREYLADATSAMTTRDPEGLAMALRKIGQAGSNLRHANSSTAHLFFANPLKGGLSKLFSTHPPIEERIARLNKMGSQF